MMSASTNPQTAVSRIGIIGAGPTGLAALKTVLDSPQYKTGQWVPTAFEARDDVGGVWLPSDPLSESERTNPNNPVPPTPLYDSLTTNLPHPIMAFSSYSFPPGTPLFPRAAAVRTYLADYAAHFALTPHIRLNTRVQSVVWDETQEKWAVEVSSRSSGGATLPPQRHDFDMLLICNGHHNVPRYSAIPGVQFWLDARLALHSIFYRSPTASIPLSDLSHATILVVGGGPSGQDVTSDLLGVVGKVISSSSANAIVPPTPSHESVLSTSVVNKPRTINLDLGQMTVTFADGTHEKIDYCILATGYEVDFPFFDQSSLPTGSAVDDNIYPRKFHLLKSLSSKIDLDSKHLTNSTWGVAPLVRHIFAFPGFFSPSPASSAETSAPSPTSIAFLGLLVRVAPLPLVERQARAALAAFAYSSVIESDEWEKEEQALRQRKDALKERFEGQVPRSETATVEATRKASQAVEEVEEYISHQWQRFEGEEQFDYRDALDLLTHRLSYSQPHSESESSPAPPHPTKEWERALYAHKGPLRAAWRTLEALGEAASWVEGIGKGGSKGENGDPRTPEEEWVDLMWRILGWWEAR